MGEVPMSLCSANGQNLDVRGEEGCVQGRGQSEGSPRAHGGGKSNGAGECSL